MLREAGVDVVASARDADDLARKTRAHHPDVAVVDIAMPSSLSGEDCIEAASGIRSIDPRMGVLMLSEFAEEQYLGIVRQVLDDPDREQLVDVLVRERLVRDDLRRGLEHRARCAAVDEFASLLSGNHPESVWQRWFERAGARSDGPGLTAKAGAAATSASKTKNTPCARPA